MSEKKIATFKNEWPYRFDGKTLKCRQGVKCELHGKEREKDIFLIGVKNGTWSHHAGNLILKLLRRRLITFYFDMTII